MGCQGLGELISKPERRDRVGFVPPASRPPPQPPPEVWLFPGWLPVLKTKDLVKNRGCLKAKLYCKAEGSVSKPHTPLPTSPSALLGGKERFLVKPCNGKPGPSVGGAAPASLRVPISTGPCRAGFARVGAVPGGVCRIHPAPGRASGRPPGSGSGGAPLPPPQATSNLPGKSSAKKSRRARPAGAPRAQIGRAHV